MKIERSADAEEVASRAAAFIAAEARTAVHERGQFLMALSGGSTPTRMLDLLVGEEVPWSRVHVFQVDERITEAANTARSFTHLRAHLLDNVPIPAVQVYPMPVQASNPVVGAKKYADILHQVAGKPPVLDLVHLGLGEDGHTASLVPGDPVLDELESDVALTGSYRGCKRMTLTFPVLGHARCLLWLVTGPDKAEILRRFGRGDRSIPAGRLPAERAILFTDATRC